VEHVFAATPRISSYLTALVAGPYHVLRDSYQGNAGLIPLSLACRRSLSPFLDSKQIFATTKAGFGVYEQAFGQPYPFAKYDQIFVPEFNFGAMENAGCITFRDEYLFRSKTTQASYDARDNTILHEMAHMWFGDLVTMKWWDDLWLNESFAEWAAHWCQARIRNATQPTGTAALDDPWVTFTNNRKNWAYRQDQLPSTHPIAADMVDLEAVELNFDGITYAKGASVLKQLVAYVGEQSFLAGLRAYFATYAWGNTTFADLLSALSKSSGRDLSQFAAQWLRTTGPNTLRAEFSTDAEGRFSSFAVRQTGATLRQHRMAIGFYAETPETGLLHRVHRIETDIAGELTDIPEALGHERPALLLLNDDDLSYAKIRLDEQSLRTIRDRLADVDSALARALCWGAAWDLCRDAELSVTDYLTLVINAVASETDLTGVGSVLNQAKTAIDFYSPREQRLALNRRFAEASFALAAQALPGSDHQLAFFRAAIAAVSPTATISPITSASPNARAAAITTTASQPSTVPLTDFLQACLAGTASLPGLTIDTDLRWRIVTQLARLGVIGEAELAAELVRDNTAQGAEKAAGARAARPDADAKAAAWELAVLRDDTPNELHAQLCGQFCQFDQAEVLEPYLAHYLATAEAISTGRDGWDTRSSTIRQHILAMLFPAPLLDRARLDHVQQWFATTELSDSVRRQLSEQIDAAERALRCQAVG
jgi:aminopeptidase N